MTDPADEETVRVNRTGGPATPRSVDAGDTADTGIDGSTVVARRESRRRQERADAARAAAEGAGDMDGAAATGVSGHRTAAGAPSPSVLPADGRTAHVPDAGGAIPVQRTPGPVIVSRSAPAPRAPQPVVDTAAAEVAGRHRSRRLAVAVVVVACLAIAVAAVSLLVLVATG